jgi:hypothetical protein
VVTPTSWAALTAVTIRLGAVPGDATDLVVTAALDGGAGTVRRVTVAGPALREGPLRVAMPLGLTRPGGPIAITVAPVGSGASPEVALKPDGSLAVEMAGVPPWRLPDLQIGDDPAAVVPPMAVPEFTSVEIRPGSWTRMRVGPLGPESMLRWADRSDGWVLPGPTQIEGTWSDSTVRPRSAGGQLAFRIDAPWPILSATAHVMYTVFDQRDTGLITIEGSSGGPTWDTLGSQVPDPVVRRQYLDATYVPPSPQLTVWLGVDAVSESATTGLNAVWFDLELAAPAAVDGPIEASSIDVVGSADGRSPYRIEAAVPPSPLEASVMTFNQAAVAVRDAAAPIGQIAIGAVLALLAAFALVGGRRVAGAGLVGLMAIYLAVGIIGIDRVTTLGRTLPFSSGAAEGADVGERSTTAIEPGAVYVSPTLSVVPGSEILGVTISSNEPVSDVAMRSVRTDGTTDRWRPATTPFDVGTATGVQVRIGLGEPGVRIYGLEVRARPPHGVAAGMAV